MFSSSQDHDGHLWWENMDKPKTCPSHQPTTSNLTQLLPNPCHNVENSTRNQVSADDVPSHLGDQINFFLRLLFKIYIISTSFSQTMELACVCNTWTLKIKRFCTNYKKWTRADRCFANRLRSHLQEISAKLLLVKETSKKPDRE